ncbi:MAG: hypothetical protein ACI3Y4_07040 [Candidatus Cryptobacteroides sp.]
MTNFKSIEELLRMLSREKALLKDMFQNRKSISYSYEMAREMVDYKSDRLTFLIEHGVIRDNGDALELEEVYLQFFENVLDVNEDISTAGVSDSLDALDSTIGYYLAEESPKRKYGYIKDIKRILHNIATLTFRNVVDLKRNIDSTYKNEPSYKVKKLKLEKLDLKRKAVTELIFRTEDYINNKRQGFFAIAADAGLRQTINEVKIQLKEAHHNILDLERQIILYLNLIEYQNRLIEKLRIVKYLRDQMVLETQTDIRELLNGTNPVWMENRPKYTLKISLDKLRNTDEGLAALKSLSAKLQKGSTLKRRKAEAIAEGYLEAKPRIADGFNTLELKNSFLASGTDLYAFICNYNFSAPVDREQKLVLFCQIASQFQSELNITDEYHCDLDIEYPIIYPAQT